MRRRDFLGVVGGAAAWPVAASAQSGAVPVIGFLNAGSAQGYAPMVAAFAKGLDEAGYADGRNVTIEYRWAEGRNERLPALAAELVERRVAVIAATSTPAALAAKAATASIPIVFELASDPVELKLVGSLSRPGGNATGVTQTNVETGPKRLELMHELLPQARVVAFLINPSNPVHNAVAAEMRTLAGTLGLDLHVLKATSDREFDAVFAQVKELHADGLVVSAGDALFAGHGAELGGLAIRNRVPTVSASRGFVSAGGLASYGADIVDAYRLAGVYTGRILKGDKPTDLPVQQSSKIELIVNLKAAKALGVDVPMTLLGRADEVIE